MSFGPLRLLSVHSVTERPPPAPVSLQSPTLEHYSGYAAQELPPLVKRLNFLLTYRQDERLKAVRSKYSHR